MQDIYIEMMDISREYMTIHRYIISRSMKSKDYEGCMKKLNQITEDVKNLEKLIEKQKKSEDYDAFKDHIRNLSWMISGLTEITEGLDKKATGDGKYGFFKYRKDLKNLDETHKIFEISGTYLNSMGPKYS